MLLYDLEVSGNFYKIRLFAALTSKKLHRQASAAA